MAEASTPGWPASDTLANLVVDGYLEQLNDWAGGLHWSWSIVEGLVRDKPDIAWPMLLELIARCPDEHLNVLAAGPLEEFLSEHGPSVIDVVETEAARNPRLRHAFALVWKLGMTNEVWARVQALADPGLVERLEQEVPDNSAERRLEVWLPGEVDIASAAWSDRLGEAIREARPSGLATWGTPVHLSVDLQTGPAPMASSVIDALARVSASLVAEGVISGVALIRRVEVSETRGPTPVIHVEVLRMPEEQIAAIDSTDDFEAELASKSIEELQAEFEAGREAFLAQLGDEERALFLQMEADRDGRS